MKGRTETISKRDQEKLVREYFSAEGDEPGPWCTRCGEELHFSLDYSSQSEAAQVKVSCERCRYQFFWKRSGPAPKWERLHLAYFYERYQANVEIRCPVDDCFVVCQEYSDGPVRFRCPFCGREGVVNPPEMRARRG